MIVFFKGLYIRNILILYVCFDSVLNLWGFVVIDIYNFCIMKFLILLSIILCFKINEDY